MCYICRASKCYRWPSWVVFEQNFHQIVVDQGLSSLARLDPTSFTQCFNGQARRANPGAITAIPWTTLQMDVLKNSDPKVPQTGLKPKPSSSSVAVISFKYCMYMYNSKKGVSMNNTANSTDARGTLPRFLSTTRS